MKEIRESLPVYQYRQALLDAIAQHPVVIIVGETGSGKVFLFILIPDHSNTSISS
jgi:HrpA-like RNA helicase